MNLNQSKEYISNLIKVPLKSIDNLFKIKHYKFTDTWQLLFDCLISREMLDINKPKELSVSSFYGSYLFLCKNTNTYDYRLNLDLCMEINKFVDTQKQIFYKEKSIEYNYKDYNSYINNLIDNKYRYNLDPQRFSNFHSWEYSDLNEQLKQKNYFMYGIYSGLPTPIKYIKSEKYIMEYKKEYFDKETNKQISYEEKKKREKDEYIPDTGMSMFDYSFYQDDNVYFYKGQLTKQKRSNLLSSIKIDHRKDKHLIKNYNLYELYRNPKLSTYKEKNYEIDHIFPRMAFIDNNLDKNYNLIIVRFIANLAENLQIILREDNGRKGAEYNKTDFKSWFNKKLVEVIPNANILI